MEHIIRKAEIACKTETAVIPDIAPGDMISVYIKIKENGKERVQRFQGTIVKIQGAEAHVRTVTVRRLTHGVAVERIFPMPSPLITKIEIERKAIVRRANLSYLRKVKSATKPKIKYKI
jgi:large subunit ribosomal protein L19